MSVVKIEEVTKSYGHLRAVDEVSLDIKEGEIFGLLGPNGAGKSTAINMIIGLLTADKGKISVLGHDVRKESMTTRGNIGIVPQDIAIYEDLTSLENVKFFGSLYGLRGAALDAAAKEALEFTGLSDKGKAYPKSFSGGMKRRLNIACALAHKPKLIVMDEPTVGIDPQSRNHILESVKRLNEQGSTIIYTSHYMEEVEAICSRVAIMDHGKIIALDTVEGLENMINDKNVVWISLDETLQAADEKGIMAIPGVTAIEADEKVVKITSAHEANNLDKIISYFTNQKFTIKKVESKTPDLETVFLSLTGRTLRD